MPCRSRPRSRCRTGQPALRRPRSRWTPHPGSRSHNCARRSARRRTAPPIRDPTTCSLGARRDLPQHAEAEAQHDEQHCQRRTLGHRCPFGQDVGIAHGSTLSSTITTGRRRRMSGGDGVQLGDHVVGQLETGALDVLVQVIDRRRARDEQDVRRALQATTPAPPPSGGVSSRAATASSFRRTAAS